MLLCSLTFVVCAPYIKTKIANPHSNIWSLPVGLGGEAGLAEHSLFMKYQLKEKTTILLIGYDFNNIRTFFSGIRKYLEREGEGEKPKT